MPVKKTAAGKKLLKKADATKKEPTAADIADAYAAGKKPSRPRGPARPGTGRKSPLRGAALRANQEKDANWQARRLAFQLRVRMFSYRDIAEQLEISGYAKVSHQTIKRWCDEEIESRIEPAGAKLRQWEVERLAGYIQQLDTRIRAGDIQAIAIAMQVSARYSKLMGLDAPQQIEMETKVVTPPEEVMRKLLEAQQAIAAQEAELLGGGDDTNDNADGADDVPPAS